MTFSRSDTQPVFRWSHLVRLILVYLSRFPKCGRDELIWKAIVSSKNKKFRFILNYILSKIKLVLIKNISRPFLTFRAAAIVSPPNIDYLDDTCTNPTCFHGIYSQIWHTLQAKMNFTYFIERKTVFGVYKNKSWNGVIGKILTARNAGIKRFCFWNRSQSFLFFYFHNI